MKQTPDIFSVTIFLVLVIVIALAVIFVICEKVLIPFNAKTRYIKMEIKRSNGSERRHWQKKLKKHYLRSVPFIGKFLLRYIK